MPPSVAIRTYDEHKAFYDKIQHAVAAEAEAGKASIDPAKIKQMKADGMGPSAIAKALKIGRASVYRALTS